MERIESPELKEYLINYTVTILGACRLFSKAYGKDFARRKLNANLSKVYIEKRNDTYAGQYDVSDSSITIVNPEETDFLTALDENKMSAIKTTMLHEALHVILTKEEMESDGTIRSGTGLCEMYQNGTELGRGLNEGFTNWICKKAGLNPTSYRDLTQIIELLEIAVGENRIIELGKGDIKRNIAKQLNMSQEETISFLAKTDEIYHTGRRTLKIKNIIQMLEELQRLAKTNTALSPKQKQEADDIITKLRENKMFTKMVNSIAFKQFQETQIKKKSINNLKLYFEESLEKREKQLDDKICLLKEEIFNKYFKKETKKIMNSKRISSKARKRLAKIYQLLDIDRYTSLEGKYNSYHFAICYQRRIAKRNSHKILKNNSKRRESRYPVLRNGLFSKILFAIKRKIWKSKLNETNGTCEETSTRQIEFRQKLADIKGEKGKREGIEKKKKEKDWERD